MQGKCHKKGEGWEGAAGTMSQESNNGPLTEAIFLRENMTLSKDSKL